MALGPLLIIRTTSTFSLDEVACTRLMNNIHSFQCNSLINLWPLCEHRLEEIAQKRVYVPKAICI